MGTPYTIQVAKALRGASIKWNLGTDQWEHVELTPVHGGQSLTRMATRRRSGMKFATLKM